MAHTQTQSELENHFNEQIRFIEASSKSYDDGFEGEAKRLALAIRILVHDTGESYSLLNQLGAKNVDFYTSVGDGPVLEANQVVMGSFHPLIGLSKDQRHVALLDEAGFKQIPIDQYWNEVVIDNRQGNVFTRKQLVGAVANQDGGAHVDPQLTQKYADLSRNNAMGWIASSDGKTWDPVSGVELASIRQIAHEILKTVIPDYPEKKQIGKNTVMFSNLSIIGHNEQPSQEEVVGRNDKCPCGSGKKYKKCGLLNSPEHLQNIVNG